MKQLSDIEITIAEAIYLCIIKSLPIDLEEDLIQYVYDTDLYMYVYLCWLIQRRFPLYAGHKDHLPTRIKK